MTLTNRLLAFLLLSHATLLAGFSVAVYAVARAQLYRQMDERSEAALDTLAASAEMESDGWDWEPHERRTGRVASADLPAWALFDGTGHRLDGSGEAGEILEPYRLAEATAERSRFRAHLDGERWRISRRILAHPKPETTPQVGAEKPRHRTLVFVAAAPQAPVESVLATLAWSLGAGCVLTLLLVGAGGRWWCRRALAPVARMTAAVTSIEAEALAERVPEPAPRDELRELAEAFNALLARVQIGYERQARFTAEASHQLRTPLAGLLGQLELALKREREPEEYRRAIAVAMKGARHLNGIVEMLLFLARPDGEAQIASHEVAVLSDVVASHLGEYWSGHPRRGDISLETTGDSSVYTRPALLGQAIHNILENAIKYSEPGTPIVIRVSRTETAVEVSIRDKGRGIAAEEMEKIFTPFYRTPDANRSPIGGVGLGLSVAKRIVEVLGGTIRVVSELEKGSQFAIVLPSESPVVHNCS